MKTNYCKKLILFCIVATLYGHLQAYGQANYMATNITKFPRLFGGGPIIPKGGGITNIYPHSYLLNRIAGDGQNDELQHYYTIISEHKIIPEIMPAEQDAEGNWGLPTDGMQASARFRQYEFVQGEKVPAYLILRNLDTRLRQWWRNGPPDYGFQFTLFHDSNVVTWMRPQQKHLTRADYEKLGPLAVASHDWDQQNVNYPKGDDPYWYKAEPKTEGLTILYLNRFFDLSQPGKYSLQVQIQVPALDGNGLTNVVSGKAQFEVVEKRQ